MNTCLSVKLCICGFLPISFMWQGPCGSETGPGIRSLCMYIWSQFSRSDPILNCRWNHACLFTILFSNLFFSVSKKFYLLIAWALSCNPFSASLNIYILMDYTPMKPCNFIQTLTYDRRWDVCGLLHVASLLCFFKLSSFFLSLLCSTLFQIAEAHLGWVSFHQTTLIFSTSLIFHWDAGSVEALEWITMVRGLKTLVWHFIVSKLWKYKIHKEYYYVMVI